MDCFTLIATPLTWPILDTLQKHKILIWLVDNPIDIASRTAYQRRTQQPRAVLAGRLATQMHTKTVHSTFVNAQQNELEMKRKHATN